MGFPMRRWRGALVLALAGALALVRGGDAGTGTWPSGLTTYTFQDGVSPTSGYTGCEDTYIRSGAISAPDATRNYGAATRLYLSSIGSTNGEAMFLIRFSLLESAGVTGGLPANFVVTYARLSVYKDQHTNETPPVSADGLFYCYRMLSDWQQGSGNGTSGYSNYDSLSATSMWPGAAGIFSAATADAQGIETKFWRTGVRGVETDSSTIGAGGFWGADTLWNSVYNAGGYASGDYASIPANADDVTYLKQYGSGTTKNYGWHYFNVTKTVSLIVAGQIKNNGWLFTNSLSALLGQSGFASSEATYKLRRPKLEVWGYTISSGGTSGRRRAGF